MSNYDSEERSTLIKAVITANLVGHCGLDIHGIFDVDIIDNLDIYEACRSFGLEIEEVIGFKPEDEEDAERYQRQSDVQSAGVTILTSIGGEIKPLIFIKRVIVDHDDLNDLARYGITLHELGHADDMIRGINCKRGELIALDKSEAHAEVFCLRQLNNRKDPISELTRNLFARRLFNMNGRDPLKKRIYDEVIKVMSRRKIATWASKSMLDLS